MLVSLAVLYFTLTAAGLLIMAFTVFTSPDPLPALTWRFYVSLPLIAPLCAALELTLRLQNLFDRLAFRLERWIEPR